MCQNTCKNHRKKHVFQMCIGIGIPNKRQKTIRNVITFPWEKGPGSLLKMIPKKRCNKNWKNTHFCYFLTQNWDSTRGGINIKSVLFPTLGPRLAEGGPDKTPKRNKVTEICKSDVTKMTQGSKLTPKLTTLARSSHFANTTHEVVSQFVLNPCSTAKEI